MQFNRLIIIISFWLTGQSVLSQGYEPPRTESGKPDLQGYWTNASITTMQRSRELADFGLTIPFDEVARLTNNNHQNVRQATDDNQVQGQLPDGTDLARGRGYNAFGSIQGLSLETFEVSTEALGLLSPMTAEFPIPSRVINRGGQPTRNFLVTAVLRVLP